MRRLVSFHLILSGLVLAASLLFPPSLLAAPMRPYAGIGVLLLATACDENGTAPSALQLYHDPAIYRLGELEIAKIPGHEWIFGKEAQSVPLIVMARKGEWLRVVYDDAGREAWINPSRRGTYHPWDDFLKERSGRLLAGMQKRYYQLFREPGSGPLVTLPPRQSFAMTMLNGDWVRLAQPDQNLEGWLRWRDADGRLLIGFESGEGLTGRLQ